MARNDWAIVVGIMNYADPDLAGLQGPENDATDFYNWVVSSDGGAVPSGQAILIKSSDFHPPFTSPASAMPTAEAIKTAFDHLLSIADENEKNGLGRTIGDRLYLFFSGHGFAPAQNDDLTALLTANASIANAQLTHVIGSYMADKFWRGKFFAEILLFMDCCRSVMDCAQLYMPYAIERATDYDKVRRFYAYGARVAKEAREWKMSDGQFHGVFTKTLLDALGGSGYDPRDPGLITAESLRDQLYNGFKHFMSAADLARPDLPKEPQVVYEQKPDANFTIVKRTTLVQQLFGGTTVAKYPVTIVASPARVGSKAVVSDAKLATVVEQTLAERTPLSLELGFYALTIAGEAQPIPFEVIGAGSEVHV
ncbi:MAG TPA: caspase family protein [Reyranella sp.]|jgi:hypothetical protein